ncbi:dynamin family protein [Bacillus gobiensis]|uniref:dynamin family protein n=1 Tax=Bacillus gobiensis TaxID=1441095 RepID=UPI003D1E9819
MTNTRTEDALAWKTGILYDELINNGDHERAKQLGFIMNKESSREIYIAFAGHYSAGKSSLINSLLNENVLPSGPIPTSANLVKVKKGEPQVTLFTSDGECFDMKGRYEKEKVQAYCKNGAQAEIVEISGEFAALGDRAVMIDTPGIDSTDHTHFAHAKSILYQADALFYVVHYNHVHSEENIRFLRYIQDKIPSIYFIVNQVDRHDESETSFEAYKNQVIDMLRNEGIKKEHLFFTSVTEPDFPLNEMENLKKELSIVQNQTDEKRRFYTETKITNVLKEHIEQVLQTDENLEELQKQITDIKKQLEAIEEKLDDVSSNAADTYELLKAEANKVISNANLTPFELREKASMYLESLLPNFKKGLFFSKAKTSAEKQARFENLFAELKERVRAEMDWHLVDLLKNAMESYYVRDEQLKAKVISYETEVAKSDLLKAVTPGTHVSSEYVMNYSSELADILKRKGKHAVNDLLNSFNEHASSKIREKFTLLNNEWLHNKGKLEEMEAAFQRQMELKEKSTNILDVWNNPLESIPDMNPRWFQTNYRLTNIPEPEKNVPVVKHHEPVHERGHIKESENKQLPVQNYLNLFENLASSIAEVDLIKSQWTNFYQKTERLKTKQFTIALFGAFSAGKSSFANALLGEKILPSSPTPTTATINKIVKPVHSHQNRTAEIVFKSVEEIEQELVNLTDGKFSPEKKRSFEESVSRLIKQRKLPTDQNTIVSNFLTAFQAFKEPISNNKKLIVNTGELFPFVADEHVSCAVKEVTVYISAPITEKGIKLVDTPGASSINKRHTEAAFQYMSEADAIVYVTYYQHSFSRADRSFIRKLGLVQDSLGSDKMFFVINASDLAQNEEELDIVLHYVKGELGKEGISQANLYPVSSKHMLEGTNADSVNQFRELESHLYQFIEQDLARASIEQLIKDGKNMCETVFRLNDSLNKSEEDKRAEIINMKEQLAQLGQHAEMLRKSTIIKELAIKDMSEQLYHIQRRISFFANDLIKSEFHPGMQNGSWQENCKSALRRCISAYESEFYQEMKAFELRLNAFFEKHVDAEWIQALQWKAESFEVSFFSITLEHRTLQQNSSLQMIEPTVEITEIEEVLKMIKSPRSFLDPKGKALFVEALREKLSLAAGQWIQEAKLSIADELAKRTEHLQAELAKEAYRQMNEQASSYEKAIEDIKEAKTLKQAASFCKSWLEKLRQMHVNA